MTIPILTLEIRDFLLYFVVTFLIISITSSIFKILTNASKAAQHLKSAKKKRALRDQQLKQINISPLDISETLREKILNSEATTLLEMLRSREVTSEQILLTYFTRASTIGLENEMITEINFEDALSQARRCDKLRKENPSACKGVLFGLPISIKDTLILKNTDASCGLASKLFNPATEDGYIVKILKGEGAIPFIKSNVPQALMTIDSRNNIWGRTKNPWNKERGAGGSSGGECALIAARCSPLGIGNDLGGSLRTPAFFCGVTGFKPTSGRITKAGTEEVALTLDYLPCLKLATGPLAKSAKDISLMMKALLSDQTHQKIPLSEQDPHYVRIPWREDIVNQKNKGLRIGYFKNIDFFASSPANSRAVDEAVRALRNRGHQIVEIDFPNIKDLIPFYTQALLADGEARFLVDALKGESPIEEHSRLASAAATPQILAKILRPLLNLLGEKRLVMILDNFKKRDAYECNQLIAKQEKLTKEFLKVWDSEKLDALISPGAAYPATKHGVVKDIIHGVCYAYIFNVLDMPTGAVPVTLVKEGEDQYPKEISKYHDMMFKLTAENMKGSVGLPVGVQVTTLPWQEEKCVSVMIELEDELQFRKKHGYPL